MSYSHHCSKLSPGIVFSFPNTIENPLCMGGIWVLPSWIDPEICSIFECCLSNIAPSTDISINCITDWKTFFLFWCFMALAGFWLLSGCWQKQCQLLVDVDRNGYEKLVNLAMNQGKIIEYIDQGKIACTLCLQDRNNKLHLLSPSNREINLSPKRTLLVSGPTIDALRPREELLERLKKTEAWEW